MVRVLSIVLALLLGVGGYALYEEKFGTDGADTQVIEAVKRTQEISLVSLGIQGIKTKRQSGEIMGIDVPGTSRTLVLQYNFDAKLGVDGSKVNVTKSGENAFLITVPNFTFIGYDDPTFKVAAEDGGVLSWTTADIDQAKAVNEILNDRAQKAYVAKYEGLLKDQTKVFYNSLITSIDPAITTTFEFAS